MDPTIILYTCRFELLKDLLLKRFLGLRSREIICIVFLGDRISFLIKNYNSAYNFDIVRVLRNNTILCYFLQAYFKNRYSTE